jgi:hypothetical protein
MAALPWAWHVSSKDLDLRIQECLDQAAQCDRRAAAAHDELARRTFTDTAKAWRELAAAYAHLKRQPPSG